MRVTSRYNTECVGYKPERDRFDFAQVLAIDMERHRAVGLEGQLAERGRADHILPGRELPVARVHHVTERGQRGQCAKTPQREQVKPGTEVRVGWAHRVAPQV